jgi:LuxR family transcriptional regulator, maltose regulon positive regulatory protein
VQEAGHLLDVAERRFADAADEPFEPSAGRASSLLVNIPVGMALFRARLAALRGDAEGAAAFASRRAQIREGERMLDSVTRWYLGMAERLRGRLPEAERMLSSSVDQLRAVGQDFLATRLCHVIGQIQSAQGRLDAAAAADSRRWRSSRRQASRPCPP